MRKTMTFGPFYVRGHLERWWELNLGTSKHGRARVTFDLDLWALRPEPDALMTDPPFRKGDKVYLDLVVGSRSKHAAALYVTGFNRDVIVGSQEFCSRGLEKFLSARKIKEVHKLDGKYVALYVRKDGDSVAKRFRLP